MSDTPSEYRPRCMHLSCKSMLVYGEGFESDPDYQAGVVEFWCSKTSKGWGPDGDRVALDVCNNQERACFQEF